MTELAQFVRYLVPNDAILGKERRIKFFNAPAASIAESGIALNDEQKAILFSMDRVLLAEWILVNEREDVTAEVFGYDFRADGDARPGGIWDKGDINEDLGCAANIKSAKVAPNGPQGRVGLESVKLAAAAGGGGWTDPVPQIWRVKPTFGYAGEEQPIAVVAEGILENSLLFLTSRTGAKANVIRYATLEAKNFEVVNFRRIYACTTLDLRGVPAGDYRLHVRNHYSAPPVEFLGQDFPVVER